MGACLSTVKKLWHDLVVGNSQSDHNQPDAEAKGYQMTHADDSEDGDTRIELGGQNDYFDTPKADDVFKDDTEARTEGRSAPDTNDDVAVEEEKFEKVSIKKKKFETKKLPKNKKLKEKRDKTEVRYPKFNSALNLKRPRLLSLQEIGI